jgi:hypothetical protein
MQEAGPPVSEHLKSEAPPQFIDEVQGLENQSDLCYEPLELLQEPRNCATWAVLVACVQRLEEIMPTKPPGTFGLQAAGMNLARSGCLLIDWIRQHGKGEDIPTSRFRWNDRLAGAVNLALDVARNYDAFRSCFPAWHKFRNLTDIVEPRKIRFTAAGGMNARRVSAFQKGLRPSPVSAAKPSPSLDITPELAEKLNATLQGAKPDGRFGFRYGEPSELYKYVAKLYNPKINSAYRRLGNLSVGHYSLDELRKFHACLLGVCAIHEHLCFRWGRQSPNYPFDSAVLVKTRDRWIHLIQEISDLGTQTIAAILSDLTLPASEPFDLHVHPFVTLQRNSAELGIAPHFLISSNVEENMLRVCSWRDRGIHNVLSQSKEEEQRDDLKAACDGRYNVIGPRRLPGRLPNLDLALEDRGSSTLAIIELKWLRKPMHFRERISHDEEIQDGLMQLRKIEEFLRSRPLFLKDCGASASLSDFANVHFLLVARDHFIWSDPAQNYPIIEHESFKDILRRAPHLSCAVAEMLRFDWLPVENRDFIVRYEFAVANGVHIESEIFLAAA